MTGQNRMWLWSLVLALIVGAGFSIYPPQDRLKGGIDLVGGTSLLYEIDTAGMASSETRDLAHRVMNILQRRVDPNGQLNLVWRPVGATRLEIQMPRPPKDVLVRRAAYNAALAKVKAKSVTRIDIELALNSSEADWQAWVAAQTQEVADRGAKLAALKTAYDAYKAAQAMLDADLAVEQEAEKAYDKALEEVERTALAPGRLEDVLQLRNRREREKELTGLKTEFPAYQELIDEVRAQYDVWSRNKGAMEDPSDLKRRIRGAGVLEFRILAERDPTNPEYIRSTDQSLRRPIAEYVEQLRSRGPHAQTGATYGWFPVENVASFMQSMRDKNVSEFEKFKNAGLEIVEKYAGNYYVLMHTFPERDYGLLHDPATPWKLVRAHPFMDPQSGRPAVSFELDARGGHLFGELTRKNKDRQLAILLDGMAMSHATIISQIFERGQITGDFSQERVTELVTVLEAGSLPARLKETPLMEYTIGPSLGEYNRDEGMKAAIYGLLAVLATLAVYYLLSGLVANLALILNLLFTVAVMALLQATFTLPGIAGLILSIGMAVDANVLICERIREERERGVGIQKALRLGYDKAFSAIFDGNLTGLITCVILGYVGSEEVKGFALTLGFGLATSMFTAVVVTRLVLTSLLQAGWIKDLPMLKLIGVTKIDWLKLRYVFWPLSTAIVVVGIGLFTYATITEKEAVYDIEFLGGTAVQIEFKAGVSTTDEEVRDRLTSSNPESVASWVRRAADELAAAPIVAGTVPGQFTLTCKSLSHEDIAALVRASLSDRLVKEGVSGTGTSATLTTKSELGLDLTAFKAEVATAAEYVRKAAENLASAKVQTVAALEGQAGGVAYEVVTVETSKDLVQTAIMAVMGNDLAVERPIAFAAVTNPQTGQEYFPLTSAVRYLDDIPEWSAAVGAPAHFDMQRFKGGMAMVFKDLNPPQTIAGLEKRIREIRLQPEFEHFQWREYQLFGLGSPVTAAGDPVYNKVAMVVVDPNVPYDEDPAKWEQVLPKPELAQAKQALTAEKSLRKVVQFAPAVAATARSKAFQAILLSFAAIAVYVWFRFGTLQFGLAAVVALVHDVAVPLALMSLIDLMGIASFRIDMAIVAALLTLIGYGLNDTIVIFDRIRENRGKLTRLSASLINDSLNQTLSRTILTSWNVFITVLILFLFGGPGVRGFAFVMLVGTVSSTYTTLAIAVPLVYRPKTLHVVVYLLIALALFGLVALTGAANTLLLVIGVILGVLLVVLIAREVRMDRTEMSPMTT